MALLRSIATVGGYTMISRLLGFARDILVAATLGAGPAADAFFVAFKLPNFFRRLFAEGAFSAAFVPLFMRQMSEGGREAARDFAESVARHNLMTVNRVIFVRAGKRFQNASTRPYFFNLLRRLAVLNEVFGNIMLVPGVKACNRKISYRS